MSKRPTYYQCGICSAWHDATWDGDCRQNDARFAGPEVMDAKHGAHGWEEIGMEDVDTWRKNNAQ